LLPAEAASTQFIGNNLFSAVKSSLHWMCESEPSPCPCVAPHSGNPGGPEPSCRLDLPSPSPAAPPPKQDAGKAAQLTGMAAARPLLAWWRGWWWSGGAGPSPGCVELG